MAEQLQLFACRDVRGEISALLVGLEPGVRDALLADLVREEVTVLIDKFPVHLQQQIIAQMANEFMEKWATKGNH